MNIEAELTSTLRGTCEAARAGGYTANYLLQILEEHGGVETAKCFRSGSEPQAALYKL